MSDHNSPVDPFTEFAEAAVQLHETYLTFEGVGFTPAQSFELVRAMVAGACTGGRPGGA